MHCCHGNLSIWLYGFALQKLMLDHALTSDQPENKKTKISTKRTSVLQTLCVVFIHWFGAEMLLYLSILVFALLLRVVNAQYVHQSSSLQFCTYV